MPDDKTPILFTPSTFARHSNAVDVVSGEIRTRNPRTGTERFRGVSPGAWGLLASGGSITAASGLTLGTGSVKLCDQSGAVYPENETVTVYNAGKSISASGGAKIVALEWTAGVWSVCGCQAGSTSCFPCAVPTSGDLTLSWVNPVLGNGSVTLAKTGASQWTSSCSNGLIFNFACVLGFHYFSITYFISGSCPGGQAQTCSTNQGNPFNVSLSSWTCNPLTLNYSLTPTSCSFLGGSGYSTFQVTGP